MSRGESNFQFNNVHSLFCGIKTSRPAELKVIGTGSNNFPSGSVVVTVSRTILFSILDSWTYGSLLWEKQYHNLDPYSKHIPPSGESCSNSWYFCDLIGTVTMSSKDHSIFLSIHLLQDCGNMVRPVVPSIIVGPFSHFSGCEVTSLVRSDTVWNATDKAFCKSMDGGFSRSNTCKKGKSISTVSIYSSNDKVLAFLWKTWSSVVSPPYLRLSVSLCYFWIWHSITAIARTALVSGSPCCQVQAGLKLMILLPPPPSANPIPQLTINMAY